MNCEEPGKRIDQQSHKDNFTPNMQEMKYFEFYKMHGADKFNIDTVCKLLVA